ncbi:MAG: GNAT family N-acetyltransferase [Actinomycetota bacterium]
MPVDRGRTASDAIEGNWRRTFQILAEHAPDGHHAEHGPILTAFAGGPMSFFNQLFVAAPPEASDLDAALDQAREHGLPFMVTAAEHVSTEVAPALAAHGLELRPTVTPGMVLDDLEQRLLDGPDADLQIRRITDPPAFETIAALTAEAFELPVEAAAIVTPPTMADEPGVHWVLAHDPEGPVACGLLVITGETAGVYNIAVTSTARGRGYGAAVTRYLVRAGRDLGCRRAVLQASPMGYRLYAQLGFDHVVDFRHFT